MSVITSVGIILFSMLIMAFFQLVPSIFALVRHYTIGKYSRQKASDLATFFILGAESAIILILMMVYFTLSASPTLTFVFDSSLFSWIMAGILIAISLLVFAFYYRKSPHPALFVSRRLAAQFHQRAQTIKNRSDAFTLGFISIIPELIFALPLYILVAITTMKIGSTCFARAGLIIVFAFISIVPLLILQFTSSNRNLAHFIRFRLTNRTVFRCCLSLFYLVIAILIIIGSFYDF